MAFGIRSGLLNRLLRYSNIQTPSPYTLFGAGSSNPQWRLLREYKQYELAFEDNIGVSTVIDIKSTAKGNIELQLIDRNSGEVIPDNQMTQEQQSLIKLLRKPNPTQSSFEFWKQYEAMKGTFGDAYIYGSMPESFKEPIDTYSMVNLYPQYTRPIYTGKYFDAESIEDIVKEYYFKYFKIEKHIPPNQIIHRNDMNIAFEPENHTMGRSRLRSLEKPISNIDIAFESRNVIGKKRGALGIFSGGLKDASGTLPLTGKNKEEIQQDFEKYGTKENQRQYMFTRFPLQFQRTALPIKDLMLYEEVSTDIMHIATKYGVPEILVKTYLSGATFENQEASERRLYQSTIIPEAEDDVRSLNNFFKMDGRDYYIHGSFAHIPVLQKNKKETSEVYRNQGDTYEKLFMKNACTMNEWRAAAGATPDEKYGDLRLFGMPEDIRNYIIGNNQQNTNSNGAS